MSCAENILLEFTDNLKPVKLPFLLYADLECRIKNISGSKNNSKKSSRAKKKYISCGYLMSTICEFDNIKDT